MMMEDPQKIYYCTEKAHKNVSLASTINLGVRFICDWRLQELLFNVETKII